MEAGSGSGDWMLMSNQDQSGTSGALLTRQEVIHALEENNPEKRLVVTPLLEQRIQSGTLDLRLGTKFVLGRRARQTCVDPLEIDEFEARRLQEYVDVPFHEYFVLHPNQLVLAGSLEYLSLPPGLAAQVITRSTYGRMGVISATAIHVHPGYKGCLTFELLNLGQVPIRLHPGLRVAQLVFYRAGKEPPELRQKYRLATRPEFPKMWEDDDTRILKKLRKDSSDSSKN